MKILLFGILFFTFANVVSAQPIFTYLKGERAITKIQDIKKEGVNVDLTKKKPCGEYFLYEDIKYPDGSFKRSVSFKVPVTSQDANTSIPNGFIGAWLDEIIIRDMGWNDNETPTAEWGIIGPVGHIGGNYIIRISHKDYLAASCLSASP